MEYSDILAYALMTSIEINKKQPVTYEKAMENKESKLWLIAMKEEVTSLYKNHSGYW